MRVLCIMGVCYLAALILLWAGRRGKISRKVAAVVSAVCLLAGSGALATAVYPIGNGYGKTVNRLTDLSGNGAVVVPLYRLWAVQRLRHRCRTAWRKSLFRGAV